MSIILEKLKRADYALLAAAVILSIIGIMFVYSSGTDNEGNITSTEYVKQTVWVCVAFILMILLMFFDISRFKEYSGFFYGLIMLLLVYTGFFGKVVNGAKSWIGIGEIGIQPSEFMKLAFMLFLAFFFERSASNNRTPTVLLTSLILLGIPALLILAQPDFGTTLVFFPVYLSMLFVSGISRTFTYAIFGSGLLTFFLTIAPFWVKNVLKREVVAIGLLSEMPGVLFVLLGVAVLFVISYFGFRKYRKTVYKILSVMMAVVFVCVTLSFAGQRVLKDYQIKRLVVFMDPSIDPKGSGWNIIQSKTAIGSGGILGRGYLKGYQSHNRYVPQQSTDFIFSIIAEEWGFLGGFTIFLLYFLMLWRILLAIRCAKDVFSSLLCAGIFGMLLFHFMINVGMVMGIMPITGIPLIFLSYGGSSMMLAGLSIGFVESVIIHRYRI